MSRPPRNFAAGATYHLINRGNDGAEIFRETDDYIAFIELLKEMKDRYDFELHRACLIPNHYHLKATSPNDNSLSEMMWRIGDSYAKYHKTKYGLNGHLWQGRFQAYQIDSDAYDLVCGIYIDLNPVRAGLSEDPVEHRWSSCGHYFGLSNEFKDLVTVDQAYLSLGGSDESRRTAYRALLNLWQTQPTSKRDVRDYFRGRRRLPHPALGPILLPK